MISSYITADWSNIESSLAATSQLTNAIYHQQNVLDLDEEAQSKIMKGVKHKKNEWYKELQNTIRNESSASVSKIIDLASDREGSVMLVDLTTTSEVWICSNTKPSVTLKLRL